MTLEERDLLISLLGDREAFYKEWNRQIKEHNKIMKPLMEKAMREYNERNPNPPQPAGIIMPNKESNLAGLELKGQL